MKKTVLLLLLCLFTCSLLVACTDNQGEVGRPKRLSVVTTLFPLYDFARQVGDGEAEVMLLLPPGVEPHHFEPKPRDLARIQEADIFIYTGSVMEPWVEGILKGIDTRKLVVVDASRNIAFKGAADAGNHEDHKGDRKEAAGGKDPHVWLDFADARIMVANIRNGYVKRDPEKGETYTRNAARYSERLRAMDERYRQGLADCGTRYFLYGGHFAFNYMADRYNLTYLSVQGVSPDAEASPAHLVSMITTMKRHDLKYIFYEEMDSPREAETIARETGAQLLPLSAGHNVTREELQKGVTFMDIMEKNLTMLRKGLQCR